MGNVLKYTVLCIAAAIMLSALVLPMHVVIADTAYKNEMLMDAVKKGEYFTVEYLLKQGADANYKDSSGKSLVDYAKTQYPKDCLMYLLNAKADIQFNDWMRAFMSDISMQDAYIHKPFAYKNNQQVKIYDEISYFGLHLPVVPNNTLLRLNGWRLETTQPDADHAFVTLRDKDNRLMAEYTFVKDSVWKLYRMTVHAAAGSTSFFSRNWLEDIFRGVRQCGPINSGLGYDPQTGQSAKRFMEARGYSNPVIDSGDKTETGFATFAIHESFFGLPAMEFSIPGDRFRYSVTVQATPEELARKIYEHTGERICIDRGDSQRSIRNDTAYIVPRYSSTSVLICSGTDEPQPVNLFDEDNGF